MIKALFLFFIALSNLVLLSYDLFYVEGKGWWNLLFYVPIFVYYVFRYFKLIQFFRKEPKAQYSYKYFYINLGFLLLMMLPTVNYIFDGSDKSFVLIGGFFLLSHILAYEELLTGENHIFYHYTILDKSFLQKSQRVKEEKGFVTFHYMKKGVTKIFVMKNSAVKALESLNQS